MTETSIKNDERIIKALKEIIELIQPLNAEVRYSGAPAHPLTGVQVYTIGMVAGRLRTFEDLKLFLGKDGYIDSVRWKPRWTASKDLYLSIHHGGGALSVTNCFRRDSRHNVGLPGAKWMPNRSDDDVDPDKVRRHIVDTEEELVELVLELLEA